MQIAGIMRQEGSIGFLALFSTSNTHFQYFLPTQKLQVFQIESFIHVIYPHFIKMKKPNSILFGFL